MPAWKRRRSISTRSTGAPPGTRAKAARDARAEAARRSQPKAKNRTVYVPRNKLAFPQAIRTKLRYCDRITSLPDSTTGILQIPYLANGMFDPQVSLGGHQPRGFDQFMNQYEVFTVHGSTLAITWMYEYYSGPTVDGTEPNELVQTMGQIVDTPGLPPVMLGLHKGVNQLAAGTFQEQMEKDRTSWRCITSKTGAVTMKQSMKTSDFFGTTGDLTGREGFTGTDAEDPTNKVYWEIFTQHVAETNAADIRLVGYLCIEYDCTFSEPIALGAS